MPTPHNRSPYKFPILSKPETFCRLRALVLWLQWVRYIKRYICTVWELKQIMMMMENIYIISIIILSLFGVVYEGRVIKKLVCDRNSATKTNKQAKKKRKISRRKENRQSAA